MKEFTFYWMLGLDNSYYDRNDIHRYCICLAGSYLIESRHEDLVQIAVL